MPLTDNYVDIHLRDYTGGTIIYHVNLATGTIDPMGAANVPHDPALIMAFAQNLSTGRPFIYQGKTYPVQLSESEEIIARLPEFEKELAHKIRTGYLRGNTWASIESNCVISRSTLYRWLKRLKLIKKYKR